MNWNTKAKIAGTTNQQIIRSPRFNPCSYEAIGPTKPIKPNPADKGVPEMLNIITDSV